MPSATHTVADGPPPPAGRDLFSGDRALAEGVARYAAPERAGEIRAELTALGRLAGSAEVRRWGELADAHPPAVRTRDRHGHRTDEVELHPAWHRLLEHAVAAGLTDAWSRPDGRLRRTAALLVWSQVGAGHVRPLSTTHAAVAALRADPGLAAVWEPLLTSRGYEPGARPPAAKAGVLAGTVVPSAAGADTVRAEPPAGGPGGAEYVLTGRVRVSAPMADVFVVPARTPGGAGCFLVPRVLPDGAPNALRLRRPDGWAAAEAGAGLGPEPEPEFEVEFDGTARALRIGEEGQGPAVLAALTEAVRLDRVTGAAAVMRQAVARAVRHAVHGGASGGSPAAAGLAPVRNVLADLAVESEAATALVLRLAAAHDGGTEQDRALLRTAVPVAKYWVAKRCVPVVAEALECLGGDGLPDGPEGAAPARLLHRAMSHALRDGAGSVQALEALRALRREPAALGAFLTEIGRARGADHRLDRAIRDLLGELADLEGIETRARRLAERMALVLQGALLVRHAPPEVADAFCASRLGGEGGALFGALPHTLDLAAIVERARPAAG